REVRETDHHPFRHGLRILGGGKRHGGRYGRGETRGRAGGPPGSELECREISERWRRLSRRCRHAVHRGSQESRSRCMCAGGQAFLNAEPYSYQGVRRGEKSQRSRIDGLTTAFYFKL